MKILVEHAESIILPKTGEACEIRIQRSFSPPEVESIRNLLGHKGAPYIPHLDDFFLHGNDGIREGLEWRFFIALIDNRPVANICTWEHKGIALLGHVYTCEEHRGNGLARHLLEFFQKDFLSRNGKTCLLNTDPGSFQEKFYASFGFDPVNNCPGSMEWAPNPPEPTGKITPVPFQWKHWPALNHFTLKTAPAYIYMSLLDINGHGSIETSILRLKFPTDPANIPCIYVLEDEHGLVHGAAIALNGKFDLCISDHAENQASPLAESVLKNTTLPVQWTLPVSSPANSLASKLGFSEAQTVDNSALRTYRHPASP